MLSRDRRLVTDAYLPIVDQCISQSLLERAKPGLEVPPLGSSKGLISIIETRKQASVSGHRPRRSAYRIGREEASQLGLARTKKLPWSEPELAILSRCAWMSHERIRLKLKAAGFTRTVTAIHLKLKRMKFKHDRSFYSAYSLAQALGIDPHVVTR